MSDKFLLPQLKRVYVKTDDGAKRAGDCLRSSTFTGVDSETAGGLDPYTAKPRLIQVAAPETGYTFLFDLFRIKNYDPIVEFLTAKGRTCVLHNAPFDNKFFMHHLGCYVERPLDTCIMGQMLSKYEDVLQYQFENHSLAMMVPRWLDFDIDKEQQLSDWSRELSQEQLTYAALDAEVLIPLAQRLLVEIKREGMEESLMTEMLMTLVVSGFEYYGIYSDPEYRAALAKELMGRVKAAEREIAIEYLPDEQPDICGEPKGINLNSAKEKHRRLQMRWNVKLQTYDKNKGEMRDSVAAEVLLRHKEKDPRLVDLLVSCETLKKCTKTHALDMDQFVHPVTNRIHSHWFQWGQPHSRLTCTKLNMLNVTRPYTIGPGVADKNSIRYCEMSFRHQFRPAPGKVFVKSDYDQLQLRALAEITQDPTMLEAYRMGEDLHCKTGSRIAGFEITKENRDQYKEERSNGKETNFAVGFMVGPEELQRQMLGKYGVWMDLDKIKDFIAVYFELYPGVKRYHKTFPDICARKGKITVKGNRQVLLKDGAQPSTEAVNFPCVLLEQSGVRLAMGRMARIFWHEFSHLPILDRPKIVLSVYDEVVVECFIEHAKRVKEIMDKEMVECMERYITTVPIKTDAVIVKSWGG